MTTSVILPVHSFVDVITNSSSEIFVAADKSTITAIKKLVDNIISASVVVATDIGGKVVDIPSADSIFTFDLVYLCYDASYNEKWLTADEIKTLKAKNDEILENPDDYTEKQVSDADAWEYKDEDGDGYVKCNVRVQVRDKTNKSAVAAAKVLSDLTAIFNIEASYN
jgi:hypothetical protein